MSETEKLTINLSAMDVGQIELLVEQGFYSNRAEFIRLAIHNQLAKHTEQVKEVAKRYAYVVGAMTYNRRGLELQKESGKKTVLNILGYLSIADDVPPELARDVFESVRVRGIFKASPAVKEALKDRVS